MHTIKNLNLIEYRWKEVRKDVFAISPELSLVIDQLDPSDDYKLYEASYQYGDLILNEGSLTLPTTDGSTVPLNHSIIPERLKKALSYSSAPLGIIMNNTVEVFIESDLDVIPLVVLGPGRMLGLLETLDPVGSYCLRNIWSSCAGARSVYMLPKISDKVSHSKIQREFAINVDAPKNYFDHFNVFKSILRSKNFAKQSWQIKILFFSDKWFELESFNEYLRRYAVQFSSYARNKNTFDVLWHFFSKELTGRGRKPNSYILDTLKHVMKILLGASPGYHPIFNDQTRGPLEEIQKVYLDLYRLNAVPTIMAPYHFLFDEKNSFPVIHSMNNPGMFETIPRMRETESLITDLVQTCSLFRSFYEFGKSGKLKLQHTILDEIFNRTELFFYHANPGNSYSEINLSSMLPQVEKKFSACNAIADYASLKFSDNGEFVRSCILINKKN